MFQNGILEIKPLVCMKKLCYKFVKAVGKFYMENIHVLRFNLVFLCKTTMENKRSLLAYVTL